MAISISASDYLALPINKGNRTKASENLGVTRNTLRKYLSDTEKKSHMVRYQDGVYEFFVKKGGGQDDVSRTA